MQTENAFNIGQAMETCDIEVTKNKVHRSDEPLYGVQQYVLLYYTVMCLEALSYQICRQYLCNFFLKVLPRRFVDITCIIQWQLPILGKNTYKSSRQNL